MNHSSIAIFPIVMSGLVLAARNSHLPLPNREPEWLSCLKTDGIRIFQPRVRIKQEYGWVNAQIQDWLIGILVDFKGFIKDSKHTDRARRRKRVG